MVRETTDTKTAEFGRQQEANVRQSVEGISVEAVVQKLSNLRVEILRALSGVSEQLTQEVNRLPASGRPSSWSARNFTGYTRST